jgi:hypothetical protein
VEDERVEVLRRPQPVPNLGARAVHDEARRPPRDRRARLRQVLQHRRGPVEHRAPPPLPSYPHTADARAQWSALERHTTAPYTLTLKSNGCIIFLAARSPSHVLVTSKHSLTSAHAAAGRAWLAKSLESVGRTEAQLAQTLWDNNWTAVAEVRLCVCEWRMC